MHKSTIIWLTIFFMSAFTYGQSKFEDFRLEEAETIIVKGKTIGQHEDKLYVIYKKNFIVAGYHYSIAYSLAEP